MFKFNKNGYPQQLDGQNILLEAKVITVANVVEAICSERPYQLAHSLEETIQETSKNKGILYDPYVVNACINLFTKKGFTFD